MMIDVTTKEKDNKVRRRYTGKKWRDLRAIDKHNGGIDSTL